MTIKIKYFGCLIVFTKETITPPASGFMHALKESKLLVFKVENKNKMLMN